jgi:hypothetical protein
VKVLKHHGFFLGTLLLGAEYRLHRRINEQYSCLTDLLTIRGKFPAYTPALSEYFRQLLTNLRGGQASETPPDISSHNLPSPFIQMRAQYTQEARLRHQVHPGDCAGRVRLVCSVRHTLGKFFNHMVPGGVLIAGSMGAAMLASPAVDQTAASVRYQVTVM